MKTKTKITATVLSLVTAIAGGTYYQSDDADEVRKAKVQSAVEKIAKARVNKLEKLYPGNSGPARVSKEKEGLKDLLVSIEKDRE